MSVISRADFDRAFCEEHLDELLHLVRVRERSRLISDLMPAEFVRLDKRILGHLRGLTMRPTSAWQCLTQRIERDQPTDGLIFAAGVVALASTEAERHAGFFSWLRTTALPHRVLRTIGRWIGYCCPAQVVLDVSVIDNDLAGVLRLSMATSAEDADSIVALTSKNAAPQVLTAVANAVQRFGLDRFGPDIDELSNHVDPQVKHAALTALLLTMPVDAVERIWTLNWEDFDDPELLFRAAIVVPQKAVPIWTERLELCGKKREALLCAAFSGLPSVSSYLRERMADESLADIAVCCHIAVTGSAPDSTDLTSRWDQSDTPSRSTATITGPSFVQAENSRDHVLGGIQTTAEHALQTLRTGFQLQRVIASYWLDAAHVRHTMDVDSPAFTWGERWPGAH